MVMLNDLIPSLDDKIEIKGLTVDSRKVEPGFLFAAFKGSQVDGRKFIPQAIKAGAAVILAPDDEEITDVGDALVVYDPNPRLRFADIASSFYNKQPKCVAAVTGTNGKSSCVTFIREMWSMLGQQAASIGTLGVTAPGLDIYGGLTTPDAAGLHERLAEISDLGVTHLAMEASSHGLDQYRMDGVSVKIAAFTNLSRDHLDYHADMDEYLTVKKRLFSEVLRLGGISVLNADAPEYEELAKSTSSFGHNIIAYGKAGQSIKLLDAQATHSGQQIKLLIEEKEYDVTLPLAGYFQVENALCSLGVVMASGVPADDAVPLLEKLSGVPGRMELIGKGVYVDFAHTTDALKTVLQALRPHTEGDLLVVFGCGGDRDRGKRAEMGKVATDLADRIYVTDDNPRTEDPAFVRSEIMAACSDAEEIGDRKLAIQTAIASMKKGDVLVVAGKGHETGQIVGTEVLPFDDRAVVKEVLNG